MTSLGAAARLSALALGIGALASRASPQDSPPTEIEIEAAFLCHFAQLVTWPLAPTREPPSPLLIAVVGSDPFADRLEEAASGETAHERPLRVQKAATFDELTSSPDILFLGPLGRAEVDRTLLAVAGKPVLTVSAAKGFARRGGMIEFRVTPLRRVAFDINPKAVSAAGLKISSQLLKIARIVAPQA